MFNWQKTLHLVRGLPGEGKSTLARSLVKFGDQVVENDDFFYRPATENGPRPVFGPFMWNAQFENVRKHWSYQYETRYAHIAGQWCAAEAFRRLLFYDTVAVANTFVSRKYILEYLEEALKQEVKVKLHRPSTPWLDNADECAARNVHGCPKHRIMTMQRCWEEFTQEQVDAYLGI